MGRRLGELEVRSFMGGRETDREREKTDGRRYMYVVRGVRPGLPEVQALESTTYSNYWRWSVFDIIAFKKGEHGFVSSLSTSVV